MTTYKKQNISRDPLKQLVPMLKYKPYTNPYIKSIKDRQKPINQYWLERRLMSLVKQGIIVPEIQDQ